MSLIAGRACRRPPHRGQRTPARTVVARVGDQIEVRVDGSDGTVRLDLPVAVVDALFSSEGDNLNIAAAIGELKNLRGNIITVSEENRQIRVWIDEVAEQ